MRTTTLVLSVLENEATVYASEYVSLTNVQHTDHVFYFIQVHLSKEGGVICMQ